MDKNSIKIKQLFHIYPNLNISALCFEINEDALIDKFEGFIRYDTIEEAINDQYDRYSNLLSDFTNGEYKKEDLSIEEKINKFNGGNFYYEEDNDESSKDWCIFYCSDKIFVFPRVKKEYISYFDK